ncbi:unnamed protein product [Paramecium sonneborni]|uniref:Uncharacterized protein n=1 Tax=Paramecium sonneborni TaxID=65129 RepID=A0A8S1RNI6_9CILI|nr:unnamed protein product [Paramecium sonneborni]
MQSNFIKRQLVLYQIIKIIRLWLQGEELKQGNQIQLLSEYSEQVFILNIMKQSNHFLSEDKDNSIMIWKQKQNNQWACQQNRMAIQIVFYVYY